jgi:hypothetical protein
MEDSAEDVCGNEGEKGEGANEEEKVGNTVKGLKAGKEVETNEEDEADVDNKFPSSEGKNEKEDAIEEEEDNGEEEVVKEEDAIEGEEENEEEESIEDIKFSSSEGKKEEPDANEEEEAKEEEDVNDADLEDCDNTEEM